MAVPHEPATIRRALAILEACGSLKQASVETGISRASLRAWKAGKLPRGIKPEDITPTGEEVADAASDRANAFRSIQGLYLRHLKKPEVIAKTSAQQAATVVGILDDKAVRAEGGPQTTERREIRVIFEVPDLASISGSVIEGAFTEQVADGEESKPESNLLTEGAGAEQKDAQKITADA